MTCSSGAQWVNKRHRPIPPLTRVGARRGCSGGLFATVGILSALHERDRQGGQRVDWPDVGAAQCLGQSVSQLCSGRPDPRAIGNGHVSIAPYDTYDRQGRIVLAVGTDKHRSTLDILGIAELAQDGHFLTNELRVLNREPLRESLERALAAHPAEYWTRVLTAVGVPAGAVNNVAEAFAFAAQLGLQPIRNTEDGDSRLGRQVASPINLSATPVSYRTRAPRHTPTSVFGWRRTRGGAQNSVTRALLMTTTADAQSAHKPVERR
jgi:crotonobetainyl-CoA:carnitine CoA-transferase CaiB-like acyl-CoA transferase